MFRIGEFSRIASVTIDTLRHYDALGLLKPAKVDSATGYRYYTAGQLQSLNRILALKEVGLSLEEIARILHDNLTTEEMRGILKAQLVSTESAIQEAQQRRERILVRLNHLNLEENKPGYEVTLKSVEALTAAAIRETVPTVEQIPQRWVEMLNTIGVWIAAKGLPMGFPMTIYHNESYTSENIDTECAFMLPGLEVHQVPAPSSPIVVRQMEAIPRAAAVIVADVQQVAGGLKAAYAVLGQWVADHSYHVVGAPREIYYGTPESYTAEIQFPVDTVYRPQHDF